MKSVKPSLGFFQLVLEVFLKHTPNIINEGLKVMEIFVQKDFKLWPRDKTGILIVVLVSNLSKAVSGIEEKSAKENKIHLYSI